MRTKFAIIQPTPFCNINCRYCYLPHRSSTKRISFQTLAQVFRLLFSSPLVVDSITIVWHASEPLVLPISFYEQAFQIIEQWNTKGIVVENSFQTNGTLITQEWCEFFKHHSVRIGVSIDGPKPIHDANRVDRAGKGTFERVMRGIRLLQENDISFSTIAVITKDSVKYPEDIWQFFMSIHPARVGFNAEEAEGANIHSSLGKEEDIDQYKKFFKRIIALNTGVQTPLNIRESGIILHHIKTGSLSTRSHTNVPMSILSFDCEGNVSTFSPELLTMTYSQDKDFIFGNVFEINTLEEILRDPKFIEVNEQIQRGVNRCRETCGYFMFCGGGFPANKICENNTFDSTESQACRLRVKAVTDAMLEHLEAQYATLLSSPENRS